MLAHHAADLVAAIHFAFVLFVPFGALLVLKWHWIAWIHLPAAAWGLFVGLTRGSCPLTALENALRAGAGEPGYPDGFIQHYLLGLIAPAGLSPAQWYVVLAVVIAINTLTYAPMHLRWLRSRITRA
jgi:hypothetical protein